MASSSKSAAILAATTLLLLSSSPSTAFSTKSTSSSSTYYGINTPYKEAAYDPHAAAEYYKDRPAESLYRLTQIVGKSSGFIVGTILDEKFKREEEVSAAEKTLEFLT